MDVTVSVYDNLNRLATVVDNNLPGGQNTTTYSYDPASNLATVTYPNGLESQFTYDDLNRITALNAAKASYNYVLDQTGKRKQGTESSSRVVNWNYDGINRLTSESMTGAAGSQNGTVSYGLDPVGNRLSQKSDIPAITSGSYTYDADDRILATETYDANANTLVTGARTFTYDFENRLKTMTMSGSTATIVYDGADNRLSKTVGAITTSYHVDDLNPTGYAQVVEELSAGLVQRTYTYGLQRINQTQLISTAWTPAFYGYDGFDSVRMPTDSTGTVTDTYDYDAWGNVVNHSGAASNSYLYRGEQFDSDLGVCYLRTRYYNSTTGRFLNTDSSDGNLRDPSTLHKYNYAGAEPVNHVDRSGGSSITEATLLDAFILTEWGVSAPKRAEMANDIWCIWHDAASWLDVGAWFDQLTAGDHVTNVYQYKCGVSAEAAPGCGRPLDMDGREPTPTPQPWFGSIPPAKMHWCGQGKPVDQVDAACKDHDLCYEVYGLGGDVYFGGCTPGNARTRTSATNTFAACSVV